MLSQKVFVFNVLIFHLCYGIIGIQLILLIFFIMSTDYICTPRDITVIESIRSAPTKTKFVNIGDVSLSKDELECLIKDDMFLKGGVRSIAYTLYLIILTYA